MQPDRVLEELDRSLANVTMLMDRRGRPDVLTQARARLQQEQGYRYRLASIGDVRARPYPPWLIPDLLPAQGLAVIYGEPGSGKTFVALDLAAQLARARRWAGLRTRKARVIYIALEGSLRTRIDAYLAYYGLTDDELADLHVIDGTTLNLLAGIDAQVFIDEIRAQLVGDEPLVIFIDTLARAMPAGNENASEDMGAVIAAADRIARELKALVALIHHSGKDATRGARGWSGLRGAVDVEIEVTRNADERTITFSKVKDGRDGQSFAFKLDVVDLGPRSAIDPEAGPDERITSCVAVMGEAVSAASKPGKDAVKTAAFITALRAQGGKAHKTEFRKLLTEGENRVMSTSGFYKILRELEAKGLVESGLTHFHLLEPEK